MIRAIGLMSGTSLDGIDAAILETDGEHIVRPGPSLGVPYTAEERAVLRAALEASKSWTAGEPMPEAVAEAERLLTLAHAQAVRKLLDMSGFKPADIDLIGFHGQTVLHQPEARRTVQIGMGDVLASLTGIDVINDFRSADVAAGGHGAPLVPLYHQALVRSAGINEPVAIVNIGGVGNVTYVGLDGRLIAFDTGPGNALIDDWAHRHTGEPVDKDGALAEIGEVDVDVLSRLMQHEFFEAPPPKSLDRFFIRPRGGSHRASVAGGWRGDAHCLHRRGDRARRGAYSRDAVALHRLRWRTAQSGVDADAERASSGWRSAR